MMQRPGIEQPFLNSSLRFPPLNSKQIRTFSIVTAGVALSNCRHCQGRYLDIRGLDRRDVFFSLFGHTFREGESDFSPSVQISNEMLHRESLVGGDEDFGLGTSGGTGGGPGVLP